MDFIYGLEEALEFVDDNKKEEALDQFTDYVFYGEKDLSTVKGHKDFEDIKYNLDEAREDYLNQLDKPSDIEEKVYNALLNDKYINLDEEKEKYQQQQVENLKWEHADLQREIDRDLKDRYD